ncbi:MULTISPECIES: Stk1 family PASTA domain-containing Ser/Thr kinase [Glutamicibacter]|nr:MULTISPECIES: Stk1 family PASTA domain-containing Ser/Thr kinase [Glutamicibacter]HCJ54036.1 Stk1 family PASTA domain-containing Ser/Thr kinase [Glutamicibacter sp.]
MSDNEALPPGLPRLINDRYEIESLIGRGGMADVYLATDHVLSRKVAVKVLRPDTASNPMVVNRFRREAKAVAGLSHPNIVSVYDTGELPATDLHRDRLPFMVMEYVTGHTLKQVIASGDIDAAFAVHVTRGVCDALDHSHHKNVVHRDIKPANVMVTDAGHVKLMDFGIARAVDTSATMTQTAAVVGTAQYFSPEQARGEQVDFRSDIYSVGCLFYELMTQEPPFTGDSPVSVAYQHVGEIPSTLSDVKDGVDPIFDPIVSKVLSKERDDRFQTAGAFAAALEDALNGIEFHDEQSAPSTYTLPIYGTHSETETSFIAQSAPHTNQHPVFAEEEAHGSERRYKSNRGLIILLTIIALLAVGIASFLVIRSIQTEAEKRAPVAVPKVLEMTEDDARAALRDATFQVRVEHEFSDDVEQDKATRTEPEEGAMASKDSTVTLFISDGSEQRTIPKDLANQSETAARDALREAGLEVGEVSRKNSATIPTDWVIGTTPELGSKVKAGSEVDLILSTGMVTVPVVTEMSRKEAEEKLGAEDIGLEAQFPEVVTADYAEGTLFKQSPAASEDVPQGSLVKISVAKAPEPEPEPTEESSPPESESPDSEESDDSTEESSPSGEDSPPSSGNGPPDRPGPPRENGNDR